MISDFLVTKLMKREKRFQGIVFRKLFIKRRLSPWVLFTVVLELPQKHLIQF